MLDTTELKNLYEAVIIPFGHPDPIGYVTRMVLTSELDEHFIDGNKLGIMPVDPNVAFELVGSDTVADLQSNVTTTLSMDRVNYDKYKSVSDMIVAFHFDDFTQGEYTDEHQEFLDAVAEGRDEIKEILIPRLATVEDVIDLLKDQVESNSSVTKERKDFFGKLLNHGE